MLIIKVAKNLRKLSQNPMSILRRLEKKQKDCKKLRK